MEVDAQVSLSRRGPEGRRRSYDPPLKRNRVTFFPLSWTVVHPTDEVVSGVRFRSILDAEAPSGVMRVDIRGSSGTEAVEAGEEGQGRERTGGRE